MFKRLLSVVLTGLLMGAAGVGPAHARGQGGEQARKADEVKAAVRKLGVGRDARVEVRLADGRKLKGFIRAVGDDAFLVADEKTGDETTVAYAEVARVKGRNRSTAAKVGINVAKGVGIVAGVAAGFTLLTYILLSQSD